MLVLLQKFPRALRLKAVPCSLAATAYYLCVVLLVLLEFR